MERGYGKSLLMGVCIIGGSYLSYGVWKEHQQLKLAIKQIQYKELEQLATHVDVATPHEVEKIVMQKDVWRPVQDQVKDTVVQVFAQIFDHDILQPYRIPNQVGACGSGFFIDDKGHILTNAHVVNQAKAIWIQHPALGKRIIDVTLVGMSERDLAILEVTPEGLAMLKQQLGTIPYLSLGDSDNIRRADDVLALGYPLGQQSLKSTTGVISGREQSMIQMSAPINPGSSGGPLLNTKGEVVGINTAGIMEANNVGYIIPINDFKIVHDDLYVNKILRKPYLGIFYNQTTDATTEFLKNPLPGGCYVAKVLKNSPLAKAGIESGDMIYTINGHRLDVYGDMNAPWSEDKISLVDYVSRLSVGEQVNLVAYRNGERKECSLAFNQAEQPAIRKIYPGYEDLSYEVMAGMVVMPLTMNHIHALVNIAPGLAKYVEPQHQNESVLVVTHVFPNSQLHRTRILPVGSTLQEVNGLSVKTLDDLRVALNKGADDQYLTIKADDNVLRAMDHIFVVLPFDKVIKEEAQMARDYRYPMSDTMKQIVAHKAAKNSLTA